MAYNWVDPTVLQEFDGGYKLLYLHDAADLAILGTAQNHCAGTHWVWAVEEKIWYFFTVIDKDGKPHSTVHAKQLKWLNKPHPRDSFPSAPVKVTYWDNAGDKYPTLATCKAAFEKAGREYEPGKWKAMEYGSTAYDGGAARVAAKPYTFDQIYYPNPEGKPEGVSDDIWAEYHKARKVMADEWTKNQVDINLQGRVFKFDRKELIVLSFTNSGQNPVGGGSYKGMFAQWLRDEDAKRSAAKKEAKKLVAV